MLRALSSVAIALSLSTAPAGPAAAAYKQHAVSKHESKQHRRAYGFLPGYRPPHVIERERAARRWRKGPYFYGPASPRFYHGRWNGGGFGPCYTRTPIGYVWTCGR